MAKLREREAVQPVTMTVADATNYSGMSRSRLYVLMGDEKIKAVKAGRRTLITRASLDAYLQARPEALLGAARKAVSVAPTSTC